MSNKNKTKTPVSIYLMHKYWGKKPSEELKAQVLKYSKENDTILDPFSGYGGIGIESIIEKRNVILNDLNPIACFINENILNQNVDLDKFKIMYQKLREEIDLQSKIWYTYKSFKIITILRDKKDVPLKIKVLNNNKMEEITLTKEESLLFLKKENDYEIKNWYPTNLILQNSRISSNGKIKVSDLFPKRALICHSFLFDLIDKIEESAEKELFKFAFTSNIANCSKLVPPILSRGEMSQGSWMTGFYIADKYLENNVFHYFDNRIKKILKGKQEYLSIADRNSKYKITCEDAKNLSVQSNSIDFVFTDFPYGDTVPYFEQSQIWNSWLKLNVDYNNEIVISDSKVRRKNKKNFEIDITKAINEIYRVLKLDGYFTFTFHSLSGAEWNAINNALAKHSFVFIDFKLLTQKTYTPRQLNRKQSIKGDIIVTFKKVKTKQLSIQLEDIKTSILNKIKKEDEDKLYDINELISLCAQCVFENNRVSDSFDFKEFINKNFKLDKNYMWKLK